jgi:hypothetical protein
MPNSFCLNAPNERVEEDSSNPRNRTSMKIPVVDLSVSKTEWQTGIWIASEG